jgi:hypothetical protein
VEEVERNPEDNIPSKLNLSIIDLIYPNLIDMGAVIL